MTFNSIRLRLLLPLLAMLAVAALVMAALTYRSVLAEIERSSTTSCSRWRSRCATRARSRRRRPGRWRICSSIS